MKRFLSGVIVFLVVLVPVRAAEPEGKILRDTWYESRTDMGKLGYMHLQAREIEKDGKKLIHTIVKETLTFKRSGDPYTENIEQESLETPAGEVLEIGYSTNLSKKQHLKLQGRVDGTALVLGVISDGKPTDFRQKITWEKGTLGLYATDCCFEGKKFRAGEVIQIKTFHSTANRVVPTTYTIKGLEETKLGKERQELLKVEQSYPKELYLGKMSFWVNKDGLIVKMEDDTLLFGVVTYELVSKDTATAPFKARVADVESPISVNKPIKYDGGPPKEIVVRVSKEDDDEPGTLFAEDGRQKIVKSDQNAVELRLLAKAPKPDGEEKPAPAEYLDSNFFIRSDDVLVKKLAKEAIGEEKDQRKQVQAIGRWILRKVNGNYEVPFATADEVARTLEGDCSEMGILGAAMFRAVGIPSRVAFGLVYDRSNPGFGGHLWTEVYLDGAWEPFDPTGILPTVQAGYIKIADYSMKDVLNPDELVQIRRAFGGRMKVEVVDSK